MWTKMCKYSQSTLNEVMVTKLYDHTHTYVHTADMLLVIDT